jgi:hypothetical protein
LLLNRLRARPEGQKTAPPQTRPEVTVRAARAISVERELIRSKDGLALLLAPPFDKTPLDPGYINDYPPGIRESDGRYTHADKVEPYVVDGCSGQALRASSGCACGRDPALDPCIPTRHRSWGGQYTCGCGTTASLVE